MTMAPGGFLAFCWRGIDTLLAGQRAEGLGKERAEPHLLVRHSWHSVAGKLGPQGLCGLSNARTHVRAQLSRGDSRRLQLRPFFPFPACSTFCLMLAQKTSQRCFFLLLHREGVGPIPSSEAHCLARITLAGKGLDASFHPYSHAPYLALFC